MLYMLKATYPGHMLKKTIETYMSPELPKRPASAKEVASFVYGDDEGYHTLLIIDVEDGKIADFLNAQTERNVYMQSRVDGLKIELYPGNSIMDAIAIASKQLPK